MASFIKKHFFKFQSNLCPPEIVNRVAMPIFFSIFLGVWYVGHFVVFPYHYMESPTLLLIHQFFGILFFVEMIVNWLCIRYVSSDFHPESQQNSIPKDAASTSFRQSYWEWKPCLTCNFMRPPRCHHCDLCKKCVLKRDHHCFFAGACVGLRNQRYFIVFCVWASVATADATYHSYGYFANEIWEEMSFLDLLAPIAVLRWILGYISLKVSLLICLETFLVYFLLLSTNFAAEHYDLIHNGLTSFENEKLNTARLRITDTRNLSNKLRAVFGQYWALNFLIPLHFFFEPCEDPVNWPKLKITRPK